MEGRALASFFIDQACLAPEILRLRMRPAANTFSPIILSRSKSGKPRKSKMKSCETRNIQITALDAGGKFAIAKLLREIDT
jgi:hypothetical protein